MAKAKVKSSPNGKVEGLTINEVAEQFSFSAQYIRRAIKNGKLAAVKVPVKEDSKTEKYLISNEAIETWRSSLNSRSRREDGRNKFIAYLTAEEEEVLRKVMSKPNYVLNDPEKLLVRANAK